MKKNRKIIYLSIIVTGIVAFAFFVSNSLDISYAANTYNFPSQTFTTNKQLTPTTKNYIKDALGSSISDANAKDFEVIENIRTKDGKYPLYSLMKNLEIANKDREFFLVGENNTKNPIIMNEDGLLYIISHGYNVSNTSNNIFSTNKYGSVSDDNIKQYITQIAIWLYIAKNKDTTFNSGDFCDGDGNCHCDYGRCDFTQGYDTAINNVRSAASKNNYNYLNYIIELVNNAENYEAGEAPSMKIDETISLNVDEDKKLITTNLITPTPRTSASNYLSYGLSIEDPNNYGAYFVDVNNNKITSTNNLTGKFKVVVPMIDDLKQMDLTSIKINILGNFIADDNAKSYVVDSTTDTSTSYPLQIKVNGNKTQKYADMLLGYVPTTTVDTSFNLYNFTKISKIDVTNSKELPNAQLEIYSINDEGNRLSDVPVKKWTSTNTAYYTTLAVGKYELCETVAPEGFELNTECVKFEVKYDKVTVTVMENSPTVPVPNTFFSKSNIPYLIGGVLLLLGISGMSVIFLRKNKTVEQ